MINSYKFIILLFLTLPLTSCDVPGSLSIRNKTSGEIAFKYYLNKQDSIIVNKIMLPNKSGENEYHILFGLGQFWTDERIKEYISDIQKVEIITPKDTTIIVNKSELYEYLKKHRKGFFKDKMIIDIKQQPPEEKKLFELIKTAYVNGRYDPDFVVTKEDIDALVPKVELLRNITKSICEVKIGEYGERE